ncbi:MAG: squalene--hopene cyclase [Mariniblastus sp.]|nr:squalene--hopene cyclase [Mariniblastus sp.]
MDLKSAYQRVQSHLLDQRSPAGYWVGELSASALSTATAITALSFLTETEHAPQNQLANIQRQIRAGITWLVASQNEDGGWGDTELSHSNISTSMLVVAAVHAAGMQESHSEMLKRGSEYIEGQGGVAAIRKRYGQDKTFAVPILANAAMAGLVSWKEVSALPFEAACVPQRFYHFLRLPVVSYAIPALVAMGQVKFKFDPPWNPISRFLRRISIGRSLKVLESMQPTSGGYLEAVPLTSFVCMALVRCGLGGHSVVQQGVKFLLNSYRSESQEPMEHGSWPIDTNLATWTTTLSINALGEYPEATDWKTDAWESCLNWVMKCQYQDVHPFTGAEPGGWGWSDLAGAVPDADDTPGAMLALRTLYDKGEFSDEDKSRICAAALNGARWLLRLQNRDNGWPTFCKGWGRFPFDRSGSDITAHVIRALNAWRVEAGADSQLRGISRSVELGFKYLASQQNANGSWLPLWFGNQDAIDDINPCYGTAKVLMAYRDANCFDTKQVEIGLRWIVENQNPDGGWGGGVSRQRELEHPLGMSGVEETALCVEILLASPDSDCQSAAQRGLQWLVCAIESAQIQECWPIGFYFAKLWYYEKLYPLIFTVSAIGRALNTNQRITNNSTSCG